MIVYNAGRAWFSMKADAEAFRKNHGLGPEAVFKLSINDRDELAGLLNALMGITEFKEWVQQEPLQVPAEVVERNQIEVPDFVPLFLAKQYAKNKDIKWIKTDDDDFRQDDPAQPARSED